VNLKALPEDITPEEASEWLQADQDKINVLEARFQEYNLVEKELRKVYGLRTNSNPTGIMYYVNSEGLGEGDLNGKNEFTERVFEDVEGSLLRPIPVTIQ
jgi:hypothetical protein